MTLHIPQDIFSFARYSTVRPNTLYLGYEYELHSPNFGPPTGSLNTLSWDQYDGYYVQRSQKSTNQCPIKRLPHHFHVSYEGLGSGADGYEIKSVVAPLSLHKILWQRLSSNIKFNTHPNGTLNQGGIHVSISRTDLTQPFAETVFTFLHQNAPIKALRQISQRANHSFLLFSQRLPQYQWHDHYAIINNENSNRYEFRLFAAQPHLMLPALEMADSLFHYARETNNQAITWNGWLRYVRSKKKYQELADHIAQTVR